MPGPASLIEFRLLVGPNLYFPRPAAKITLDIGPLLGVPTERARAIGAAFGLSGSRPGAPGSGFRQRFVARAVAHLVRRLARASGTTKLAVRSRPGSALNELVVAFPWRHAGRAEALGTALAEILDAAAAGPELIAPALARTDEELPNAPRGESPQLLRPKIPVIAVTGTNGKTTTSRMLGFIAQHAGLSVGWSSTDGVYINGELVEAGDYSGPSGASQVLKHPGVQLAVTETARGGILRRGVGVAYNDVSVVTNISADHLGLGGIDTLDQLAEVKAVITKITKPHGWCVLNADDPRTFAMRQGTKARIWVFTRHPDSPNGRTVLDEGGRVTTVLDDWVCVLEAGRDPLPVVDVAEVPMTLAGLSEVNVENVLAVTSASLALGFSVDQVSAGLRAFLPGENNPGRMNIWTLPVLDSAGPSEPTESPEPSAPAAPHGTISVVIDLAHNEAGLAALLKIARGIMPPGRRLLLGVGAAGDRGDDVFVRLGEMAGLNADLVELMHKDGYFRGRQPAEMAALWRAGAAAAGVEICAEHDSEVPGLASLVGQAEAGDVVAMMAHQDRAEIDAWLAEHGGTRDDAEAIRAKVAAAGPGGSGGRG